MMDTSNNDPAMRYEDLARFAFDCGKWGDPWAYAAQEVYHGAFMKPDVDRSKKILSTILTVLIYKNRDSDLKDRLLKIEKRIETITTQTDILGVINDTINLI